MKELPPRTRRIRFKLAASDAGMGTTSACAENTLPAVIGCGRSTNYLRVRGEYQVKSFPQLRNSELPPRARRIPAPPVDVTAMSGTTSACAENTQVRKILQFPHWNYLRVRGEYINWVRDRLGEAELPPRARRIPGDPPVAGDPPGTTSACAENTLNELGLL